jgi:RNA-directed DNA polymerase
METLQEAYQMSKSNNGAPGIDGVTFGAIEESGVEGFLKQIQDELDQNTYRPMPVRKKEIPKDGGTKVRVLSIPAIRDRVVQGALKLILEPIFEADFQSGSYGYRRALSCNPLCRCLITFFLLAFWRLRVVPRRSIAIPPTAPDSS